MSKWVKEKRRYVPPEDAPGTAAQSASNPVFNRIFERYSANQDMAAQWRENAVSAAFNVSAR